MPGGDFHTASFSVSPLVATFFTDLVRAHRPTMEGCDYDDVFAELILANFLTNKGKTLTITGDARKFFVVSRRLYRDGAYREGPAVQRRVLELAKKIGMEADRAWPPRRVVELEYETTAFEYRPNGDDSVIVAYTGPLSSLLLKSTTDGDPFWTHDPCPFGLKIGKWFFFNAQASASSSMWAKRWKMDTPYEFQWGIQHLDGHAPLPSFVFDIVARSGPFGKQGTAVDADRYMILRGLEQNIMGITDGGNALTQAQREVLLVALDTALMESGFNGLGADPTSAYSIFRRRKGF